MPLDLTGRKWPSHDPALRGKPEMGRIVASAWKTFVGEGAVMVKEINLNGQMAPIPRESSRITSLAMGDGALYGVTSGEESWLFQYALTSFREAAVPLGPIPGCCEVHRSLALTDAHDLYGAGSSVHGGESRLFRVTGLHLPGDVIQEWGMPQPHYEDLGVVMPGEQVICLMPEPDGELLYGLTRPGGILFTFQPDNHEIRAIGEIDPVRFFSPVLVEHAGAWYTFGAAGRMMRYTSWNSSTEETGVSVPCFPGRGPYARLAAAVVDPNLGRLYVGDTEGLLSIIDLAAMRVTTLGKPVAIGGIDHLARISDGRIYGLAGSREGMAHLFVFDPRAGDLRDLGVLCATTEKPWYGYRFGAMAATAEGRLILGEDDHMGCLFSYFPPVLPQARSKPEHPLD
jgi:hypothetical protein